MNSKTSIKNIIAVEFEKMSINMTNKLIESMYRRLQLVIDAKVFIKDIENEFHSFNI